MFVLGKEIFIGIAIGLLSQLLSLICLFVPTLFKQDIFVFKSWLCVALSLGVLTSLFKVNGYIVSAGFILPYLAILLMPFAMATYVKNL